MDLYAPKQIMIDQNKNIVIQQNNREMMMNNQNSMVRTGNTGNNSIGASNGTSEHQFKAIGDANQYAYEIDQNINGPNEQNARMQSNQNQEMYQNNNIGPGFIIQEKLQDQENSQFDGGPMFQRSVHDNQSNSDISRKTFQRVNLLGKNGSRRNFLVGKSDNQSTSGNQNDMTNYQTMIENQGLSNWSYETMNKILYSLLQQIELVKYMISEDREDTQRRYDEAGQKIVDNILKTLSFNQSTGSSLFANSGKKQTRTRIHSIEFESIKEIFVIVNNFALHFIKNNMARQGCILLQCAVQITKHYQDIMDCKQLLAALYNNLSVYHTKGRGQISDKQSQKYIDGAILAQMRVQKTPFNDINLAISLNNKAVLELKRRNLQAAKENSIKSIDLLEPKLFGMLNSGLITRPDRGPILNDINVHFQKILQVLLIAYFNYGVCLDQKLESRQIYLRGMQLCIQFHKDGQHCEMFKRFYLKYSRKHYQIMLLHKNFAEQRNQLESSSRLPVPEVLPLECIYEDTKEVSESIQNETYNRFIQGLNQNKLQQNNDHQSFTIMDSTRTRVTHLQNQVYDSKLLLPKINESAVSMPPIQQNMHNEQNQQDVTGVKPKPQMSEMVNPYERGASQPNFLNSNNLDHQNQPMNMHVQQQNNDALQMQQQKIKAPGNDPLNLEYKDSIISRDVTTTGMLNINTPTKKKEDRNSLSIGSSNLGTTAKFGGGMSDTRSGRQYIGGPKDPNIEYENRLMEEKNKIKMEFEMEQQDLQKKMNENMQFMHQMMFQQQQQMQLMGGINPSQNQQLPIVQTPVKMPNPNLELLGRFGIFTQLNDQQRTLVAQNLIISTFQPGNFIFKEKDMGDFFFLIEKGSVDILKYTEKNPNRFVRQLTDGDHFGELALMSPNNQRTMSARALTDCSLISIPSNIFSQIRNQIDNLLKKDYNGEFNNKLANEKLEEQYQAMKAEKEAIEKREKDLNQKQAEFEMKQKVGVGTKPIAPELDLKKVNELQQNQQQPIDESPDKLNQMSQENMQQNISKTQDDSQTRTWNAPGTKDMNRKKTANNKEPSESAKDASCATPGGQIQSALGNEGFNPNQGVSAAKQLSRTNLSEDDHLGQKPAGLGVEKTTMNALTPKHGVKHPKLDSYIDFHYEKLNEQDENDLGFDDLMRQHQSLINQQEPVQNSTLLNFEQLVNTYDYLEDDQIRNQFYIDNLQNQQDNTFKWSPLQIKALIYLREHHRLYSAQNIWKFNQKLLEQIKREKTITCTKVLQQLIGQQDLKPLNFKVAIKVEFSGTADEDSEDEDDARKYLESVASKIKIKIKADIDKNQLPSNVDVESVTPEVELSFLELQTILYMFNDINSCDPSPILSQAISSIPFYHIDRFEDLCEILLFKYIDIFSSEEESFDHSRSQLSRQCPYTIDFKETPSNLFFNPIKILFLQQDTPGGNLDGNDNDNLQNCSQSDNLQGQASNSDWGLSMFNNNLNCQVEVFQVKDQAFKIVISPSFDLSSIMTRMQMMQQNNGLPEVQSVQPENLCILPIDLKFDNQDLIKHFFNSIDHKSMKFASGTNDIQQSIQPIANSQEFYDGFLKKYIDELDKILKREFEDFFSSSALDAQNGGGEGQLNNHQRFFNLVIHKKFVYSEIRIEDVINAAQKKFKSRMTICLKNFDHPQTEGNPAIEKPKHDMKFICLYTDQTTDGQVKACEDAHLTTMRQLSAQFGQEIDLGYYSLQKHYNLTQVCKIIMQSFNLIIESEESSASDSGLGSSGSDEFDSDSDENSNSNSEKKKQSAPKEFKGKLNACQIDCVHSQREVRNIKNQAVALTSEILVCNQLKKILGIKFTAYDVCSKHESGVFLQIDASKWPQTEGQKVEKAKFWTNYSVVYLLKDFGIEYFKKTFLMIEPHRNNVFKNKMVLRLKEPRLPAQRSIVDMNQDLENNQNIDAEQRQRIMSQMMSDQTTISQLERFLTKEFLEEKIKNKS